MARATIAQCTVTPITPIHSSFCRTRTSHVLIHLTCYRVVCLLDSVPTYSLPGSSSAFGCTRQSPSSYWKLTGKYTICILPAVRSVDPMGSLGRTVHTKSRYTLPVVWFAGFSCSHSVASELPGHKSPSSSSNSFIFFSSG